MHREVLKDKSKGGGSYFAAPAAGVSFFSSGCTVLDLALGGGWAKGRVANIIGDKSTGKTLLCIEACANFAMSEPKGRIFYREAEAAFDPAYAEALGMPIDRVEFGEDPLDTVEDMFEDLSEIIKKVRTPVLYICDSLDALTDRAELARDIDKGSFGTGKAKQMSQLLRRLIRQVHDERITIIIVSQVRSKIGVMFGPTTTRTGGRALDFYSSQVIKLSQRKTLVRTIGKTKRTTGMWVHAKVDKCKVGLPFREADFPIKFGYGIDDQAANAFYLKEAGLNGIDISSKVVQDHWYQVEQQLLPSKRKYE